MGLFGDGRDENEPTLGEAWQMLAGRMGVTVEELGERSIRAQGTVRGRGFSVAVEGDKKGSELLRSFAYNPRGSRTHVKWRSELAVACANLRQLSGTITSFVDVNDPRWSPKADLNLCRVVKTDPPTLGTFVLSPSIHAQLMSLWMDATIVVDAGAVRLQHENKTAPDSGYMVGSIIHQYVGPPQPWPERALVGPPFWTLLLCEIAEAVDAA